MVRFGGFVLGFTCLLWTFILLFSMAVRTEGKGRSRVICTTEPIVSALGDDVILPCQVDPQLNVENLTVKWWKPDVKLDPGDPQSNYRYVHSYHDNHDEEDMKMSRYTGRTTLFTDGLKHGNISLKIINVRLSDQGRYRCQIPQLGSASVIELVVVKTRTTETPLHSTIHLQTPGSNDETDDKGGRIRLIALIPVLLVLLILGGVAGYLLRHKCQKQHRPEYDVAQLSL